MSGSSQSAFSSSGSSSSQPQIGVASGGGGGPADFSLLWATPYVVSTNANAPYQPATLQNALNAIAASGDERAVLLLEPGTYTGDFTLSVTADQTIVIQALAGNSDDDQLVEFAGAFVVDIAPLDSASVTFNGCRFRNPDPALNSLTVGLGAGAAGAVARCELQSCAGQNVVVTPTTQDAEFVARDSTFLRLSALGANVQIIDSTLVSDSVDAALTLGGSALITDALLRGCTVRTSQGACARVNNAGGFASMRVEESLFGELDAPAGPVTALECQSAAGDLELSVRDSLVDLTAFASIGVLVNTGADPTSRGALQIERSQIRTSEAGICVSFDGNGGQISVSGSKIEAGDDGIAVQANTPDQSIALYALDSSFSASSTGSPVGGVISAPSNALDVTIRGRYTDSDETVFANGDVQCINTPGIVNASDCIFRNEDGGSFPAIVAANGVTLRECEVRASGICVDVSQSNVLAQQTIFDSQDASPAVILCSGATLRNVRVINGGGGGGVLGSTGVTLENSRVEVQFGSGGFGGVFASNVRVRDSIITCAQTCISAEEVDARNCVMLTQNAVNALNVTGFGRVTLAECQITCFGTTGGSAVACAGDLSAQNTQFVSNSSSPCLDVEGTTTLADCRVRTVRNFAPGGGGGCLDGEGPLVATNTTFECEGATSCVDVDGGVSLHDCRVTNTSPEAGATALVCTGTLDADGTFFTCAAPDACVNVTGTANFQDCRITNTSAALNALALSCGDALNAQTTTFASASQTGCVTAGSTSFFGNCFLDNTGGGPCLASAGNMDADNSYFACDGPVACIDVVGRASFRHCRAQNGSADVGASVVVATTVIRAVMTQLQNGSATPTVSIGGGVSNFNNCIVRNTDGTGPAIALTNPAGNQTVRVQNSELTGGNNTPANPTITKVAGTHTLQSGQLTTFAAAQPVVVTPGGDWTLTSLDTTPAAV